MREQGNDRESGAGSTGPERVTGLQHRTHPATDAEAKALASAIRLRILRLCLDRALTNKEIATRLGANPATTLHHVRTLVATGFLAAQPERRGTRGAREVPYLATKKSWTLDMPQSNAATKNTALVQAFLEEIRLIDAGTAWLARLGLRLGPDDRQELLDRVDALLDEYAARPADPDGEPVSLFVAVFPDAGRD